MFINWGIKLLLFKVHWSQGMKNFKNYQVLVQKWVCKDASPFPQLCCSSSPYLMLAKSNRCTLHRWVCIDLPHFLHSSRQQVRGVVLAAVRYLWWYLALIKFFPLRESWKGVKGDKKPLQAECCAAINPVSFSLLLSQGGWMEGSFHIYANCREVIKEPWLKLYLEMEEQSLHPFVVVALKCFKVRQLRRFISGFMEAPSTIKMDLMAASKSLFLKRFWIFMCQLFGWLVHCGVRLLKCLTFKKITALVKRKRLF